MSDPRDHSDDERWRTALAPLREGGAPPPELEDRLVRALRTRRGAARWIGLSLAALLLLSLGGLAGRWLGSRPAAVSAEPRFLLLLFEGPGFDTLSSSHAARVAEYGKWARELARNGRLVDAGELAPSEQRLGTMAASGGDLIGGMFIVKAKDAAEARAIAATCPHLKHGGGVSVRLIRSS